MYQNLGRSPNWDTCFQQAQLTEENLRSHSSSHKKTDSACQTAEQQYYQYDGDFAKSDDGDAESRRDTMALRKAASMEVLKAYGGCFASGFLALQDPLPTRPQPKLRRCRSGGECETRRTASVATSLESASISCASNLDSPRPDSATLSPTELQSVTKAGKWSWKSLRKCRKQCTRKVEC